jgi:hypothetical protein
LDDPEIGLVVLGNSSSVGRGVRAGTADAGYSAGPNRAAAACAHYQLLADASDATG